MTGVILMGGVGVLDLSDLLSGDGDGIASWPLCLASTAEIAKIISSIATTHMNGSLKTVFVTVRLGRSGEHLTWNRSTCARSFREPMPLII